MNAYPLLYGRTQYVDYLNDFLVRPNGIDYARCGKYVLSMIKDLNNDQIRYGVFVDGEYIISGISCFIEELAKRTEKTNLNLYARDNVRRGITFFIGYAFPKSGFTNGTEIPDIRLENIADVFLKYIPEQWKYPSGVSGKITSNQIDVRAKKATAENISVTSLNDIKLLSNINERKAFEIFLQKNLSGDNSSFISNVSTKLQFDKLAFEYAIVDENVVNSVKRANEVLQTRQTTFTSVTKSQKQVNPLFPIVMIAALAVGGIAAVVIVRILNA